MTSDDPSYVWIGGSQVYYPHFQDEDIESVQYGG